MKRRYITIGILLLIVVNISALAALGYRRYCIHRDGCAAAAAAGGCDYLCEELELSPDQILRVEALREDFRQEAAEKNHALQQLRLTLVEQLSADRPGSASIDSLCGRISRLQAELQRKVIANILREKEILSPGQQKEYLNIIKSRLTQGGAEVCAGPEPSSNGTCAAQNTHPSHTHKE